MKGVFQFWGYSADLWSSNVAPGRLLEEKRAETSIRTFGKIFFTDELTNLVAENLDGLENGVLGYVYLWPCDSEVGEVLVWMENGKIRTPLVTRTRDDAYWFHFDVDQSIEHIQQEDYFLTQSPIYVRLGLSPEKLPALLRKLVLVAFNLSRGLFRALGAYQKYPALYKDTSVDMWRFLVRAIVSTHVHPSPEIKPLWPNGKRYAVILNHDVDTLWGLKNDAGIKAFRELEERHGFRSAWMIVTRLCDEGREFFRGLAMGGHEIGCHGTAHDHNIAYLPEDEIRERLDKAQDALEEFESRGFRSPSYHRSKTLYAQLDGRFEYDMSMHDCFENANSPVPSFEGCSTCFPFRIAGTDVLEIPTTVTEDFVLELAGESSEEAVCIQAAMVQDIARRNGVANILTHAEPMMSSRVPWIHCYEKLLETIAKDDSAWVALPRDLCDWWNRREAEILLLWPEATEDAALEIP